MTDQTMEPVTQQQETVTKLELNKKGNWLNITGVKRRN